jgi:hypothetical protein
VSDVQVVQRLLHKCHKDNCEALAEFAVRLHLRCPAPGGPAREISSDCTIRVCAKHRADVAEYVLSPQNRETIATTLMEAGAPEPDFLSAAIEFVPIEAAPVAPVFSGPACNRAGCGQPAKWQIKQFFRRIGQRKSDRRQLECLTDMYVCDQHKADTKAGDLIARPEDYKTTRDALVRMGMRAPDMHNGRIEFVPVKVDP